MSFTQEKRTNINPKQVRAYVAPGGFCDGCDKLCKLGCEYISVNYTRYIYPTINGFLISCYVDENYQIQTTSDIVTPNGITAQARQKELTAKVLAGKIARLCDNYKTR